MKNLYTENYKTLIKETKEDTNMWKGIHAHGLEEFRLLKCPGISLVGPVPKTPHSQCRGLGFDRWSGN